MDFNPDLFQALLEQDLGNPSGIRGVRAKALANSVLKKYVPKERAGALHSTALENFKALNEKVKSFIIERDFLATALFAEWKRVINDALYSGDLQSSRVTLAGAFANGMCGPGSSVGAPDNLFFTKMFDCHLTTTSCFLYDHYRHCLNPRWLGAELFRLQDFQVKVVPGSKLSSVPKDRTKNRTTCTEPILNMFYQLGVKTQIESVLRDRFLIDLSTQPDINQRLARIGSLDDGLATIDMKDASDSISVELCRELLPPAIFRLLMYIRSPRTHCGNELIDLAMISTMGNGFTFALMTFIFAALVRSVYNCAGVRARNGENFGVFGDDIIILKEHAQTLIDALTRSGLTVNEDKSFLEGPFRESCGGDFYLGHNVRGVYIKRMNHETHVYSAFNRLHFWALRHGFKLSSTLSYLLERAEFRPVPADVGDDAGFIVTTRELEAGHPKGRNGTLKYQGYRFRPRYREQCSDRFRNHYGGLITFLGGYLRDNRMELRVPEEARHHRLQVVTGETPSWDFINHSWFTTRDLSDSWQEILISC